MHINLNLTNEISTPIFSLEISLFEENNGKYTEIKIIKLLFICFI